ncbi:MAG: hypothetical protein WAO76_05840 [Georgfuchsia sp.]
MFLELAFFSIDLAPLFKPQVQIPPVREKIAGVMAGIFVDVTALPVVGDGFTATVQFSQNVMAWTVADIMQVVCNANKRGSARRGGMLDVVMVNWPDFGFNTTCNSNKKRYGQFWRKRLIYALYPSR